MACYIYGAGAYDPNYPTPHPRELVIGADGGYKTLKERGITPDVIVGDFDSLGYIPDEDAVMVLPKEKDVTDLWAAVEVGIKRKCNTFVLLCATGGRPDHTYANYQLLYHLAKEGFTGYLMGDGYTATVLIGGSRVSVRSPGFSLFAPVGVAEGVEIQNAKYPLTDATLTPDFPLGVSNETVGGEATISLKSGALLVMWEGYEAYPIKKT